MEPSQEQPTQLLHHFRQVSYRLRRLGGRHCRQPVAGAGSQPQRGCHRSPTTGWRRAAAPHHAQTPGRSVRQTPTAPRHRARRSSRPAQGSCLTDVIPQLQPWLHPIQQPQRRLILACIYSVTLDLLAYIHAMQYKRSHTRPVHTAVAAAAL